MPHGRRRRGARGLGLARSGGHGLDDAGEVADRDALGQQLPQDLVQEAEGEVVATDLVGEQRLVVPHPLSSCWTCWRASSSGACWRTTSARWVTTTAERSTTVAPVAPAAARASAGIQKACSPKTGSVVSSMAIPRSSDPSPAGRAGPGPPGRAPRRPPRRGAGCGSSTGTATRRRASARAASRCPAPSRSAGAVRARVRAGPAPRRVDEVQDVVGQVQLERLDPHASDQCLGVVGDVVTSAVASTSSSTVSARSAAREAASHAPRRSAGTALWAGRG